MLSRGTTAVVLLACGPAAFAQPRLTREGGYWEQNANGSLSAPPAAKLRISATGNVTVRGDATDRIAYVLKRRMKARDSAEAEKLLRGFEVRTTTRGEWTYLIVRSPASKTMSADLSVTVPRSLREAVVESYGGNIGAYDLDGVCEITTAGGRVDMDRIRQNAVAKTGGGDVHIGNVGGSVKCYSAGGNIKIGRAGGESWFETAGGEVYVGDVQGPIHVSSGGGNIKIGRSTGTVYARTGGGVIEVEEAAGLVEAENSGGSIQVNAANGVRCSSNAGAIRLRNVDGALRASTSAGNILADLLSGHRILDSVLSTNGGDITVLIPSNIAMTVVARNQSPGVGRIVSDFPEIHIRQTGTAEGTLNGGGPVLRISANGGIIYLRRK